MLLSGKEFKEKYLGKKFYKLTNKDEFHNGFQIKSGLNVDTIQFDPSGECKPGGIYFTDLENITKWIHYSNKIMNWFREVIILDNSQIYVRKSKYKADFLYLRNRKEIWTDENFCKLIIKNDGMYLKFVKDQTDELCKLALEQDGNILRHVKSQTYEMCKIALRRNPNAIKYVKISPEERYRLILP